MNCVQLYVMSQQVQLILDITHVSYIHSVCYVLLKHADASCFAKKLRKWYY